MKTSPTRSLWTWLACSTAKTNKVCLGPMCQHHLTPGSRLPVVHNTQNTQKIKKQANTGQLFSLKSQWACSCHVDHATAASDSRPYVHEQHCWVWVMVLMLAPGFRCRPTPIPWAHNQAVRVLACRHTRSGRCQGMNNKGHQQSTGMSSSLASGKAKRCSDLTSPLPCPCLSLAALVKQALLIG